MQTEEKQPMVGFVLTGHGDFATGVASALEMIAGPQELFEAVPFHEGEETEFPVQLTAALEKASADGQGAVVFCDLLGGTPFNQAMILSSELGAGIEAVAGANLPMLLEVVAERTPASTVDEILAVALEAGKTGVVHPTLDLGEEGEQDDGEGL